MKKEEWQTSNDPQAMITFLIYNNLANEALARLFATACCRQVWDRIPDGPYKEAVDVIEQYAIGNTTKKLREAYGSIMVPEYNNKSSIQMLLNILTDVYVDTSRSKGWMLRSTLVLFDEPSIHPEFNIKKAELAELLRDIFGPDPTKPVPKIDSTGFTSTVNDIINNINENNYYDLILPPDKFTNN